MSLSIGVTKLGDCQIDPSARLRAGVVIGKPFRKLLDGSEEVPTITILAENVDVGYYSIVGTGCRIGPETIIDDHCIVESRVEIGRRNLLIYRSHLCNDVRIGNDCIIGGFVGERTVIGNSCRIFGQIVHLQTNPLIGWDNDSAEEEAPVVKDYAFIGFGAIVAGSVTIGRKSYVCAGARVTKNVPDYHIAAGSNEIRHFMDWKGRLSSSPFFRDE